MLHGYGPALLGGLWTTLSVAALSLAAACLFGLAGAIARLSRSRGLQGAAIAYTTLIRGLPDLVLMLLIFYGGQIALNDFAHRQGWDYIDVPPYAAGVLTLGFIYGAYLTETFRGAILAVPRGQSEAAQAYGMRPTQVWRRIVLPQMVRQQLAGDGEGHGTGVHHRPGRPGAPRQPGGLGHARALHVLHAHRAGVPGRDHGVAGAAGLAEPPLQPGRARGAFLMIDGAVIAQSLPEFGRGLLMSLQLLVICLATGGLLSVPLAIARISRRRWLAGPVWAFTYVIRGTPLLVQVFIVYYGLAQFPAVRESIAWPLLREAWFCAWLAFSLNTTAYTTEIIAGALRATPAGEVEAARAYGLQGWRLYRRVLLPSALRRALPQYGNEVVSLMHATSIASTVTLVDVTRVARDVYANHLLPMEAFGMAAVIYFVLTFTMVGGFRALEHRYLRHLRPQTVAST